MAWAAEEFGDTWAEVYDEVYAHLAEDAEQCEAFLRDAVPPPARILELGVGTGRLAIPLVRAGYTVVGVDASERMLQAMAAKPGGEGVRVVCGDMVDPPVEGPFEVVLLAFNTLFALPTQDAQVRCVVGAARLLAPGGLLAVEAAVPQPWRFSAEARAGDVRDDQVALEVADHDPVAQVVRSARVVVNDRLGVRTLPLKMRYAWPSEIDLMARLAGLVRRSRTADWTGAPFDADATRHLSVYRKDP